MDKGYKSLKPISRACSKNLELPIVELLYNKCEITLDDLNDAIYLACTKPNWQVVKFFVDQGVALPDNWHSTIGDADYTAILSQMTRLASQ